MDKIRCVDLFEPSGNSIIDSLVFSKENPWQVLKEIQSYIVSLIDKGLDGFTKLDENVYVGKNVKIAKTATIIGPTIICDDVEIRPGAYIRGSVIVGPECVVGNSSELKNAVLMKHAQVPHYNYVGDSIVGNYAHMGAGSILSNLKSDGKNIVLHGEEEHETGLRKIGGFLGDHADIGCGSVLNPGTVIGKNTQVYPLSMLRGIFKEDRIVKSQKNVVIKEKR